MSAGLPSPRSPLWPALLERIRELLGAAGLGIVATEALERARLEKLVVRFAAERSPVLAAASSAELSLKLDAVTARDDAAAYELFRELDRAAQDERAHLAELTLEALQAELPDASRLRKKRRGARLVWALCRDELPEHSQHAREVVAAYVAEATRLVEAARAAADKGAAAEAGRLLAAYDEARRELHALDAELSQAERDRAILVAEVGRREAELKEEAAARRELAEKLAAVEQSSPLVSPPPAPHEDGPAKLKKRVDHLERELVRHGELAARVRDLSDDNERLRRTVSMLRAARAVDAPPSSSTPPSRPISAPVADPPQLLVPTRRTGRAARVGVFLDVANLAGAARRLHGRNVDYFELLAQLLAGRTRVEAHAYAIEKDPASFEAFAAALRKAGYRVHGKRPKTFADGSVKADWDVGIATDVMGALERLDVVVLGSGDGDFAPLVKAVQGRGLEVEVAAFADRTAQELEQAATRFVQLGEGVLAA